ncbi:hypothetical protein PN419_03050 [Halorubrum ezzemoulense]|jgi:hypothetical protein|uniref:Uncharacterized protein n=1 Tax=Halorubrum ezzemoulense TaxID=337243 RepID=A0A238UX28_HALEZ|nr:MULTISPECIES: hypothetical protein [Halorubrum]MDB2260737.1 hypothetical protein [Halorubrum ezzemoulense]MDB2263056.1 hypothetical protein [Halorubrum ezzemoulense]MDB2267991.1 hypothetical protein [Halorubrum ezzemoulense]MDB2282834.1 hypothetical protein [Halorubrum ezzemoulense]MDB9247991.1 hypothetical protein [Halorubrum ezzemoulense]
MTDPDPDSTDDRPVDPPDGRHRQHASADVAPELFEDASERR